MYILKMQHLLLNVQASIASFLALKEQFTVTELKEILGFFHFKRQTIQILCCHWLYKTNKSVYTIELHHILELVCTEKGEVLDKRMPLISCQRSHDLYKEKTTLPFWESHAHNINMRSLNKAHG